MPIRHNSNLPATLHVSNSSSRRVQELLLTIGGKGARKRGAHMLQDLHAAIIIVTAVTEKLLEKEQRPLSLLSRRSQHSAPSELPPGRL